MLVSPPESRILWRQVWGLSALLAAITLSWMAYGFYQPQILQNLGFVQMAGWLGVIQGLLGVGLEPLVGGLSDRVLGRYGSRLPLITIGVTVAGLIFVTVALMLRINLPDQLRWLVPTLMTLWVMSMIVFRGPVLALLQQTAPLAALPQANTVFTIVFGVVAALDPVLNFLFQQMGGSITFMLGAIALVLGASVLYLSSPPRSLPTAAVQPKERPNLSRLMIIFGLGLGTGLAQNIALRTFPASLTNDAFGLQPSLISTGILLISALSARPLQTLITKLGVSESMLWGVAAITLGTGIATLNPTGGVAVGLMIAAGVSFGLIFSSQIPFALRFGSQEWAGLSTGFLLGGVGAATALISALVLLFPVTSTGMTLLWAIIALLITAGGILAVRSRG
jgi:hypothetical protein